MPKRTNEGAEPATLGARQDWPRFDGPSGPKHAEGVQVSHEQTFGLQFMNEVRFPGVSLRSTPGY